jgi:regulator of RNase E activity RraA
VRPGDLVVGDDDGIVVGSAAELDGVIATAEAIVARERVLRQSIEDGVSIFEKLNLTEHVARLTAGETSALRFEG